jgi:hypothetical protein
MDCLQTPTEHCPQLDVWPQVRKAAGNLMERASTHLFMDVSTPNDLPSWMLPYLFVQPESAGQLVQ